VNDHIDLAYSLHQQGQVDEARKEYQTALMLDPGWPQAFLQHAWTLATTAEARERNSVQALQMVAKVRQAEGERNPRLLEVEAAALAENRQFDRAVQVSRAAIERAKASGQVERVKELQKQLKMYEQGQAYRRGEGP
jgi:tetratricopeptide (TPR) repeat protein